MSFSRHRNDSMVQNGRMIGTAEGLLRLRIAMRRGQIPVKTVVLKEGQRLDHIAQTQYQDGRLWWVIAACSGIGWWLQAPPGTRLLVPTDLTYIEEIF